MLKRLRSPLFAQHEKSRALVLAICILLLQALGSVVLGFWSSAESNVDATAVNVSGRQRMLSQRLAKCLLELDRLHVDKGKSTLLQQELKDTYDLFDQTLASFSNNTVVDRGGNTLTLGIAKSGRARSLIKKAYGLWTPFQVALRPLLDMPGNYSLAELHHATAIVIRDDRELLTVMNDLTDVIEDAAHNKVKIFNFIQGLASLMLLVNFAFVLYFFRRQLNQLAESKSVLRRMMENIATAIIVMDNTGNIESGNRAAENMFGYAAGDLAGMNMKDLFSEPAYPIIGRRSNGERFSLDISLADIPEMKRTLSILSLHDVSAQKAQEEKLSHLAYHDALTGLPNRLLFLDRLEQTLARAHRHNELFAVLFIDLDGFKPVNDLMGHDTGDLLLQSVASRLTSCLREGDTIARMGGDEFTMIVDANDADSCDIVTRKILGEVNRTFELNGRAIQISASIGVGVYPSDARDIKTLLQCADTAMYRAKALGGNTYCYYPAENTPADYPGNYSRL